MAPTPPGWLLRASTYLLDALTLVAALFTSYVVVGGIWTGEVTLLTEAHPAFPLGLLGVVILLIGGLEGLQISVSNLQKKDLTELREEYPGAVALHETFKNNDEVMKNFFGGRQFLIVALVFLASRLTTFPGMQSFPLTDVQFPALLSPWFQFLFLDLGLLGALFVLWLGNLTAQFVAADHPVEFLDIPGMYPLFTLCLWVDRVRLPRPANWLSAYFNDRIAADPSGTNDPGTSSLFQRLPVSPAERWRRELESESGFALTNITHEWRLYEDRIEHAYTSTYLIEREGIGTVVDDHFQVPKHVRLGPRDSFRWTASVVGTERSPPEDDRGGGLRDRIRRLLGSDTGVRETDGEADGPPDDPELTFDKRERTTFHGSVPYDNYVLGFTNRSGHFEPGVKVQVEVEAELVASPTELTSSQFLVDHPCAELELRIDYEGDFDAVDRPRVRIYNPVHEKVPNSESSEVVDLEVRSRPDGGRFSVYSEDYPRDRSRYEVVWNVDSDGRSQSADASTVLDHILDGGGSSERVS